MNLSKPVQTERFYLLLILIAASLAMLPILLWGLPRGFDMPHHYQCALTFYNSILSGDFYPSWTLDRNFGYGALELRMYPPLSHYVLALFFYFIQNWHLATWLTFTFWAGLGGFGVYLWAREMLAPRDAAVAAALYVFAPYNLHRVYLIFLYSEYAAGAILPFCFFFAARLARFNQEPQNDSSVQGFWQSTNLLNIVGLTISIAALILTHLPATVIGLTALFFYALLIARPNLRFSFYYLSGFIAANLLAVAATAFFWTKVLQERFLMAKTAVYDEAALHYQSNFLLTPLQSYNETNIWVYESVTSFVDLVLLATLAGLTAAIIGLWAKSSPHQTRLWRGVWATFAATLFLSLIVSKPLWDLLPTLQEIQFPWRWLTVVAICIPVLTARGIAPCLDWLHDKSKRPLVLIAIGLLLLGATFTFKQIVAQTIYVPPSQTEDFVADAGNSRGFEFWWTIWTRKEIFNVQDKIIAGNREVQIQTWTATKREFQVTTGAATTARIAVFYHPNWQATINDVPVKIEPDSNGALVLTVPAVASQINLEFHETGLVKNAGSISNTAWLIILLTFGFSVIQWLSLCKWQNAALR